MRSDYVDLDVNLNLNTTVDVVVDYAFAVVRAGAAI